MDALDHRTRHDEILAKRWTDPHFRELRIARTFCRLFGDAHICDNVFRESPDFLICHRGRPIGLELTAYVMQCSKNELESKDSQFRDRVKKQWQRDPHAKYFTVQFEFKTSPNGRLSFPKETEWCRLVEESLRLVPQEPGPFLSETINFHPVVNVQAANRYLQRGVRVVVCEDYPVLAKHCSSVLFTKLEYPFGEVRTNVGITWLNLDLPQLQRTLEEKFQKAPTYRCNIGGAPVWLLIHVDGNSLFRRLSDRNTQQAIQFISELHQQAKSPYDRVYLLNQTKGTQLHLVGRKLT